MTGPNVDNLAQAIGGRPGRQEPDRNEVTALAEVEVVHAGLGADLEEPDILEGDSLAVPKIPDQMRKRFPSYVLILRDVRESDHALRLCPGDLEGPGPRQALPMLFTAPGFAPEWPEFSGV